MQAAARASSNHGPSPPRRGLYAIRRLAAASAVLVATLALVACGGGGDEPSTTTVTFAGGATTTAATVIASPQAASSDAAGAVPGSDSAVLGAASGVGTGEVPNDGAVTIDPTTGQPLPATTTTTPSDLSGTAIPPTTSSATPTTTPTAVGAGSTAGILSRPFSTSSPWNMPIAGEPLDPKSEELIRRAQIRVATVEQPNGRITQENRRIKVGLTINVTRWTVPVFSDTQPGAVPRVTVCRQFDCGPDATSSITIPPDACSDPRYDGWMTALDSDTRIAYDFWRARCEADGSLSYHYVKAWELDGPGYQQPTGVSARGSGLPLFAGLITPEEIDAGRIEHALAISVPGAAQRKYVQPASRTDGTGSLQSLPEGARLRLRGGATKKLTSTFVRNGTERRAAATIIEALERYGAIVVDRSAAPTMYAQRNADWMNILPLNLLQDIPLSRFDVIDLDQIHFDPPKAGEQQALPIGTPPSIPGTASGSQGTSAPGVTSAGTGEVVSP